MDFDDLKARGSRAGHGRRDSDGQVRGHDRGDSQTVSFLPPRVAAASARSVARGTGWLETLLERMEVGDADVREIGMLDEVSRQIEGHTILRFGKCGGLARARCHPPLPARD